MRYVDEHEWSLLKRRSASHLTDPHWLGGGHCISASEVSGRVLLPADPWDAAVLARQAADPR